MTTLYAEAYGCAQNQGETRKTAELMFAQGYRYTSDPGEADVILVGTCAVIETTSRKILKRLGRLREEAPGARMLISGCMSPLMQDEIRAVVPEAEFIPIDVDGRGLEECIELGEGERFTLVLNHRNPGLFDPHYYIVPIAQGCLGNCTYCITKLARGGLRSYPAPEILGEVRRAVEKGFREIRITSQDTITYGLDLGGVDLPELMHDLNSIEGDFMVRVGMMSPGMAWKRYQRLLDAFGGEKIYKFLHAPVQHGSPDILKDMRRPHTVDDYKNLVREFRRRYPLGVISTDIIVGYPGETKEDFRESMALVSETGPDVLNITRFSPRPGTEAYARRDEMAPGGVIKDRSRAMSELHRKIALERNASLEGETLKVMVTERAKKGGVMGRDKNYRPVVINRSLPLGSEQRVVIVDHGQVHLEGELV